MIDAIATVIGVIGLCVFSVLSGLLLTIGVKDRDSTSAFYGVFWAIFTIAIIIAWFG